MKGTYCLSVNVCKKTNIEIGGLGKVSFKKGDYAYIGSALNGLEKRIERHYRNRKKKFWHIDFLLANRNSTIKKAYFKESTQKIECSVAKEVAKHGQAIQGFGCSDCRCQSHLFAVKDLSFLNRLGFKEFLR